MVPAVPIVLSAAMSATPAASQPAATLRDLGPALTACFRAPERSAGSQVTVLLSLTRTGTVLGKPRITFSHLVGAAADQRAFLEAALGSLASCTPVAVTPSLGAAIAGRPFSIRFIGGGAARAI